MSTARVKQGGVWVPFDGGHISIKGRSPGQDPIWNPQPAAINVKQGGAWVKVVLPWG